MINCLVVISSIDNDIQITLSRVNIRILPNTNVSTREYINTEKFSSLHYLINSLATRSERSVPSILELSIYVLLISMNYSVWICEYDIIRSVVGLRSLFKNDSIHSITEEKLLWNYLTWFLYNRTVIIWMNVYSSTDRIEIH